MQKSIWRQAALIALLAIVVIYTLCMAMRQGIHNQMPGAMSRHRDAMAVAITYVSYGLWDGYASYRSINQSLLQSGLSVNNVDLKKIGLNHYFEVMTNPTKYEAAIQQATKIENPTAGGMYYMQDEKGMAILYILAFSMFGIHASSLFYLYLSVFLASTVLACIAFRKHVEVITLFLLATCALSLLTFFLPQLPQQDINLIQSNRFLGVLSMPAVFHLLLLVFYKVKKSKLNILLALMQTFLLFTVVNARGAVMWQVIAILALGIILWLLYLIRRPVSSKPILWPVGIVLFGFLMFFAYQNFGYNEFFKGPEGQRGHVFWHNFITALHNNPLRSKFAIPEEYPTYDDQVGYYLFNREISKRGKSIDSYVVGDADWIYRTTDPGLDFKWDTYDRVLQDVFFKTIYSDPVYALKSFVVYQPLALISILTDIIKEHWQCFVSIELFGVLFLASILAYSLGMRFHANTLKLLGWSIAFSLLPVFVSAIVELRVPELLYLLILSYLVLVGVLFNFFLTIAHKILVLKLIPQRAISW